MGDFLSIFYTVVDTLSLIFFLDAFATRRWDNWKFKLGVGCFIALLCWVLQVPFVFFGRDPAINFGVHNKRKGIIQRDFQFHAVAFGLHRVPCDLLPVFWPWYDGRFHLWDGRRGFSLKLSTCDGLWRNQLFGRTFSNIYIPKGHEAKKAFEEVQQPD